MKKYALLISALAALSVGVVGLLVVYAGSAGILSGSQSFTSNGQRIYFTATDSVGRPIAAQGGMMMRLACASCHGPDGHGLLTPMFASPNITYKNLADPSGMLEPDGERGPTYDDETLKRAITGGVDPEGKPLSWPMPRWRMTDQDLNDLIDFLKTLP